MSYSTPYKAAFTLPYWSLRDWIRRINIEIRQFVTQDFIPGTIDEEALAQIQELLLARSSRKERQQLKDVYALLIWNITPSHFGTEWENFEFPKEMEDRKLDAEETKMLSQIEEQLHKLNTPWDQKRSKWTYVTLIRNMEAPRMVHQRGSGSRPGLAKMSSDMSSPAQPSTSAEKPMTKEIRRTREDCLSGQRSLQEEVETLKAARLDFYRRLFAVNEEVAALRKVIDQLVMEKIDEDGDGRVGGGFGKGGVKGLYRADEEGRGGFKFFDKDI